MIDASSEGIRCRATREIRMRAGIVTPSTEGTIQYEFESKPGPYLVHVDWDNGLSLNVPPGEIEIVDGNLLWH